MSDILGLVTTVVSLVAAIISLIVAFTARRKSERVNRGLLELSQQRIPRCIEGLVHVKGSPGTVRLRVKSPDLGGWRFAAASMNSPRSVWVQACGRPDAEGFLDLEAWGFAGRYAVFATREASAVTRLQELQARAAAQRSANVVDLPAEAIVICEGTA